MASLMKFDEHSLTKLAAVAKLPNVRATIVALLALGILPRLNRWFSRRKVNNYVTDTTWDWTKEVVIITGGSSGIGECMAEKLAQKQTKVIILDVNEPKRDLKLNIVFYKVDITDSSAIASVAKAIRTEHGDPTVLINNAGIGNAAAILDVTEEKLRKLFDVNLVAPFLLVQEFLPSMVRNNHGHIVNIASMASFATQACNVDYACSKSAVLSFHEGLTQELRHIYKSSKVRTSVVHPSWVRTPMITRLIEQRTFNDPTVSADDVATRVVDALYSGYGSQMCVPESLNWTSMIRGMPAWLQEGLRDNVSTVLVTALEKSKSG
ncbi:hypothetical protein EDB80DRAFT_750812 [Ilyonectria destructans]|nr:hypothetical protein EDB80DRAFT_750812 [Ilyonectria destructans]